ncbi:MAG: type II secretion system F family protein [Puniceicoccales bacterium]|nr:type II secretion system F family protein [Puniceicoccales bacterium]
MESLKTFTYFGEDGAGGYVCGEVRGTDAAAARRELESRSIGCDFLVERRPPFWRRNLKKTTRPRAEQLVAFTHQLALLLRAGIHLVDGLEMLAQREERSALGNILAPLAGEVRSGRFLYEAMELYPNVFDETYRNIVRAGESSGDLAAVLESVAESRRKSLRSKTKAISAAIYPLAVLAVALAAVLFLTGHVIPRFQSMLQDSAVPLHPLTRAVMAFSEFLRTRRTLIFAVPGALALFLFLWSRTVAGRRSCSALLLRIPLLGNLIRRQGLIFFFRTLGSALGHGVPFPQALRLSCRAVANVALRNYFESISVRAGEGVPLGELLLQSSIVPPSVRGLIAVGESSGTLSAMSLYAADILEEELGSAIERLAAILQPAVVLLLAGTVALVAASLFLPMSQMLQMRSF